MTARPALALFLASLAIAVPVAAQAPNDDARRLERVLRHVNVQRSLNAAGPLRIDRRLAAAAQAHAEDMARRDYLGHRSPTGQGLQDRLRIVSYPWRAIAENVAAGLSSPEGTVESWMTSPVHRENMLDPVYVHLGIGHAAPAKGKSATYRHYWVVVFGAPSR